MELGIVFIYQRKVNYYETINYCNSMLLAMEYG